MRLLVTGGRGLLGTTLTRVASARGEDVSATYHQHGPGDPSVRWLATNFERPDQVETLMREARADAVVHTAYTTGPGLEAVTRDAAIVVARACHRSGVRLVHLSTDVVFGGRDLPYVEDDIPDPVHDYGRAKAAAERAILELDADALIVRTSLLYAGDRPGPQEHLAADTQVTFFTDEIRNPIAVRDLADAILTLVPTTHRGLLHIAGPDALDRLTFARLLARSAGIDPAALRGGPSDPAAGPRPKRVVLDCTRALALLPYPPRSVAEVLGETTIPAGEASPA